MTKKKKITAEFCFSKLLLKWHVQCNARQMPWKGEKDPYKIWLSEIILQQTRVEQGLRYYNSFISTFPDVHKLAKAPEEKVLKLWEGLGYYSRCRNLLVSARFISKELKGTFPANYETIKALKGVGPYTAAAIASFAYNLPYAVVDGNVFRVLSRIFGISIPVDTTHGKKYFASLAGELIDKKKPGLYNQAIMDFGAVVCKPVSPLCEKCFFKQYCVAFGQGKTNNLPVKSKSVVIRKRWFYYIVFKMGDQFAIRQRAEKDVWQGLYEFPMIETVNEITPAEIIQQTVMKGWLRRGRKKLPYKISKFTQQLSHQFITGYFLEIDVKKKQKNDWKWITKAAKNELAFPAMLNRYFDTYDSL
ncbi:MAG: A/G-specific adenine glycosylase [Chitinophagaceae bacterium]|nr:A/G-specific adenine glycosylase [Chitinophagaceae bacterium]MBK8952017.1 A/G-specific adenine glycosylase [Chitinophagaceae bacterium]